MADVSLYEEKCDFGCFDIQIVQKRRIRGGVSGRFDGNAAELIFCIIFHSKICVKIIPKLEKSTTQVRNMCYNIVG